MFKIPARIISKLILIGCALIAMILSSCSSYKLALLNHNDPMYPVEYVVPIAEDTKIDTLYFSQFRWKLRTDFNFRWDYAQYAMNQPYNWYSSFSYNVWRPFNSFDVYFNRYNFGMIGHSIILIIGDLVVGIIPGDIIGIDLIIGGIVGIMALGIIQVIM